MVDWGGFVGGLVFWFKYLFILFWLILHLREQQLHRQVKDALVGYGVLDTWSLCHFGQGVTDGFIRNKTTIHELLLWYFGWEFPSPKRIILEDFILATAWEVFEFGYEGDWSWKKYQEMYNGHALINNGADVAFSVLGTWLTSDPSWFRRIIWGKRFVGIKLEWRL